MLIHTHLVGLQDTAEKILTGIDLNAPVHEAKAEPTKPTKPQARRYCVGYGDRNSAGGGIWRVFNPGATGLDKEVETWELMDIIGFCERRYLLCALF